MKKAVIKILVWFFALLLIGVLVASYYMMKGQARYSVIPTITHIEVEDLSHAGELLPEEIIISHLPFNIKDSTLQAINTEEVEQTLMDKIPFVKSVNAYVSPVEHRLNINIIGRKPILRFWDQKGSFFLDEEGNYLPTKGGISVYLPLVKVSHESQNIRDEVLLPLAHFLQEHDEWYSFFGMIEVISPQKIHFYPRVGDYVFETLGVDDLDSDLDKIKLFYKKIVPQVGANKYKLIKLSYDNQIVCKKR